MTTLTTRRSPGLHQAPSGTPEKCAGLPDRAGPVHRGDLADHDGRADHRSLLRRRRQRDLAGLCVRHRDAALRGRVPEPVRQAVGPGRVDVRVHGPGTRAHLGRGLRVQPDLGLPLHRGRRTGGLLDLRRPVPLRNRNPHRRAPGDLLLPERGGLLVHRLQGHPRVLAAHAGVRGRLGGVHPRPGVRGPVQARTHDRHHHRQGEGHDLPRAEPGRRDLHLLPGRFRECDHARR